MKQMAWRGALVAAIMAGLLNAAVATPEPGDEPWLRIETPNFTLYGEIPEMRLLLIANRLEAFRTALERLHPGSRASPRQTSVYVFRSAESGWPYTPAAAAGGHRLGVAQKYDVPNYVTVAAPEDDPPLDILFHSYAHQFLDDNFPRLPLTVTEGLAAFYSGFEVTSEGSFIGLVNSDHVQWMREESVLPLAMQFAVEPDASLFAQRHGRDAFVSGSWALVHYLVSGSGPERAKLPEFLQALQRGAAPADATRATFGFPIEDLERRIATYIRGDRFLPLRITGDGAGGDALDREPPQMWPLARDEMLTALGEVLGHAGPKRAAEAETYFKEALRLNPRQARAHAGIGYLRYADERFAKAIGLFEKAIAIEPDAMTCYLLARSLLKVNMSQQREGQEGAASPSTTRTPVWLSLARKRLSQAIEIQPRFAAPYVTLGATHLLPDGNPELGIPLLLQARDMLPGRTDISGSLVYLLLRQGDYIRAKSVIEKSLVHGGDEATLKSARTALAAFESNLATKQTDNLRRNSTPKASAADKARQEKYVEELREALAATDDPDERRHIEGMLKGMKNTMLAISYNEAVAQFNEAIESANRRDYPGAIALLEELLPKIEECDYIEEMGPPESKLKARVVEMLERFRKDAARLQQPVQ